MRGFHGVNVLVALLVTLGEHGVIGPGYGATCVRTVLPARDYAPDHGYGEISLPRLLCPGTYTNERCRLSIGSSPARLSWCSLLLCCLPFAG